MADIASNRETASYIKEWAAHYRGRPEGDARFKALMLRVAAEQELNATAAERLGRNVAEYRRSVAMLYKAGNR